MNGMNISAALDTVARVTGTALPFAVQAREGDGLAVSWQGEEAVVTAQD